MKGHTYSKRRPFDHASHVCLNEAIALADSYRIAKAENENEGAGIPARVRKIRHLLRVSSLRATGKCRDSEGARKQLGGRSGLAP